MILVYTAKEWVMVWDLGRLLLIPFIYTCCAISSPCSFVARQPLLYQTPPAYGAPPPGYGGPPPPPPVYQVPPPGYAAAPPTPPPPSQQQVIASLFPFIRLSNCCYSLILVCTLSKH